MGKKNTGKLSGLGYGLGLTWKNNDRCGVRWDKKLTSKQINTLYVLRFQHYMRQHFNYLSNQLTNGCNVYIPAQYAQKHSLQTMGSKFDNYVTALLQNLKVYGTVQTQEETLKKQKGIYICLGTFYWLDQHIKLFEEYLGQNEKQPFILILDNYDDYSKDNKRLHKKNIIIIIINCLAFFYKKQPLITDRTYNFKESIISQKYLKYFIKLPFFFKILPKQEVYQQLLSVFFKTINDKINQGHDIFMASNFPDFPVESKIKLITKQKDEYLKTGTKYMQKLLKTEVEQLKKKYHVVDLDKLSDYFNNQREQSTHSTRTSVDTTITTDTFSSFVDTKEETITSVDINLNSYVITPKEEDSNSSVEDSYEADDIEEQSDSSSVESYEENIEIDYDKIKNALENFKSELTFHPN